MTCPAPTPSTNIDSNLALQRIDLFLQGKWPILDEWLQTMRPDSTMPSSITYTNEQIREITHAMRKIHGATGARVYYACYQPIPPVTDPFLPPGSEYYLTLIFATTDSNNALTGDYFTIDNKGELPFPAVKKFPNDQVPLAWINYYQTVLLPLLQQAGQTANPSFRETKSLLYPISSFEEWVAVINCSGRPDSPIVKGVEWNFATYLPAENYADQLGNIITLLYQPSGLKVGDGGNNDFGDPCPPDVC